MPRKSKKVVVIDEAGDRQSAAPDNKFFDRKQRFAAWSKACPTKLERKFFKLVGSEEGPFNFIPQFPMSGYLLDFFSPTFNICIEVDGPEHAHRKNHDAQRDKVLAEQGVRTLRISAGDLNIYTPHAIISLIESFIAQVQVQSPAPQAQASKATTHAQ